MRVLKSLVENSRQLYSWHTRCELYTRPQHCPQCHNCEPRLRVTLMCTLYARFYGNLCTIKIDRVLSCIVLQELISCWLSVQPSVKVHCRPDPITKHQGLRSWLVSRFTPYVVMAASICSWCSRFCWCRRQLYHIITWKHPRHNQNDCLILILEVPCIYLGWSSWRLVTWL